MINLLKKFEGACPCGKQHTFGSDIYSGHDILKNIPEYISKFNAKRAYVICDENTHRVAGTKVEAILTAADFDYTLYMFERSPLPNEEYIDLAIKNICEGCDILIAVGSGVINDIGKLVSLHYGIPYLIVATAPSMDGYASQSSSVVQKGLKISLPSRSADVIIGDIDVIKTAPKRMVVSGIGDMLAKYVSICEWRISQMLVGEYYCERIAELVRFSLKKCTENVEGLLAGDDEAIANAFDALTISSVAMNYAGISRPASGSEHYISHILDMRSEEFGTPCDFHGIQCGIATYLSVKLYDKLRATVPDKERALAHAEAFDYETRAAELRALLGKGAENMISLEAKEGKFDRAKHRARLDLIIENYDKILEIAAEELPTLEYLDGLYEKLSLQKDYSYLGIDKDITKKAFLYSGDIRDKYVLSRLAWDLGIENELAEVL